MSSVANSVANPISSNQVVSVAIDLKCLDVPCPTLNNVLQAVVDKVCDETDFDAIDYGCASPATTLTGALQSAFTAISAIGCAPGGGTPVTDGSDLLVEGIQACSSDGWDCSSRDACFDLTNSCSPGDVTVALLFQKLIDRNVAYGNTIKGLCDRISELEQNVADLQLSVATIQSSCCP